MLAALQERVGKIEQSTDAAWKRIERLETLIRDDFKEQRADLQAIRKELEPLNAWMNRGKGGIAVLLTSGGMIGGLIVYILTRFFAVPPAS